MQRFAFLGIVAAALILPHVGCVCATCHCVDGTNLKGFGIFFIGSNCGLLCAEHEDVELIEPGGVACDPPAP